MEIAMLDSPGPMIFRRLRFVAPKLGAGIGGIAAQIERLLLGPLYGRARRLLAIGLNWADEHEFVCEVVVDVTPHGVFPNREIPNGRLGFSDAEQVSHIHLSEQFYPLEFIGSAMGTILFATQGIESVDVERYLGPFVEWLARLLFRQDGCVKGTHDSRVAAFLTGGTERRTLWMGQRGSAGQKTSWRLVPLPCEDGSVSISPTQAQFGLVTDVRIQGQHLLFAFPGGRIVHHANLHEMQTYLFGEVQRSHPWHIACEVTHPIRAVSAQTNTWVVLTLHADRETQLRAFEPNTSAQTFILNPVGRLMRMTERCLGFVERHGNRAFVIFRGEGRPIVRMINATSIGGVFLDEGFTDRARPHYSGF